MTETKLTDFSAYELQALLEVIVSGCIIKGDQLERNIIAYANTEFGYPKRKEKERELEVLNLWRVKILEAYGKVRIAEEIAMN